jgi:hypothetical protein
LRRVATVGDGWYGFNLADPHAVAERLEVLRAACAETGRDPEELYIAVALENGRPEDVRALSELGIDELVLVEVPPDDPAAVHGWLTGLAERWDSAAH